MTCGNFGTVSLSVDLNPLPWQCQYHVLSIELHYPIEESGLLFHLLSSLPSSSILLLSVCLFSLSALVRFRLLTLVEQHLCC